MVAICLPYPVGYYRIVARAWGRRESQVKTRGVDLVDLYALDFGELLHAALHLHGLCGLVAEALYEFLGVLYLFLLVLVGTSLLLDALLMEHHIFRVVDSVVIYLAKGNLDCAVGDIVYERTVVAYKHDSAGLGDKKILKPLYRLDVKMVGRLVKQQHVGALQ